MLRPLCAVLLALSVAAAAANAGAETQVYRPAHRPAEELLPIARVALEGEGSVALDSGTNALILIGEGPALRRTLDLLSQQDQALRNVAIHYESRSSSDFAAAGVAIDWRVVAGDVRIGTIPGPGGASLLSVRPEASQAASQRRFAGTLRVLEGRSGRLVTGSEVPVVTRETSPWGVHESTDFVRAESGFEVSPRVLGDGRVRLGITPFTARLAETRRAGPIVERSGAATSVDVAPGETVVLGQLASDVESGSEGLRGGVRSRTQEETLLLVRVELN